jgi:hypothetical protein
VGRPPATQNCIHLIPKEAVVAKNQPEFSYHRDY